MKKGILGILLAIAVILPLNVHAADWGGSVFLSIDENMSQTTLNNNNGDLTCSKTEDGSYQTCYIGIRVTSGTAKTLSVEAELTNMTFDSFEELNGWSMKSPTQSGNNITFEFSNRTGVEAGNTVLLAGVTFKVDNTAEDCHLTLKKFADTEPDEPTPNTPPACRVEGGKYYCKNAQECTKAEYESQCVPETGSFIPYLVVLIGIGIAGALYFITRKKAKIYNV